MITIKKSPTADSRTCDYKKVSKNLLIESSYQHIEDVRSALNHFRNMLYEAGVVHDKDKITDIDQFHEDFQTGFEQTIWWDRHRTINRHHLAQSDGIPKDVNLIDVLEYIADCVMAGKARNGTVYKIDLPAKVLQQAFNNTFELLKAEVKVEG